MTFTSEEKKERRMLRLAQLIHDHWEEGSGMDTRFFAEPLIHNTMVTIGKSTRGDSYCEHIVPRAYIRDECVKMYENGASVEQVKDQLKANLWIAFISPDEAETLNKTHKTTMPDGWVFGESDPLERLKIANIKLVQELGSQ